MQVEHERAQLHAGIQRTISEHEDDAYVIGWILTVEVADADGQRRLLHRSGDLNGESLTSWQALGYLHASVESTKDVLRENTVDAADDDEEPEP